MILGIDEVGRGPWAGPLVVGAVVLGGTQIEGLTDSKKLSKKRREELDREIREHAAGFGLGWVRAPEIDEVGLTKALQIATIRAVEQVKTAYHEIIIDGTVNFLKDTNKGAYVTALTKADLLVPSVSAASIIAKVARDNYMADQDKIYEGYRFASHVGYGTAVHRAAIERLGVTPLHRLSFAPLKKYNGTKRNDVIEPAEHLHPNAINKDTGNIAESYAADYLVRSGHQIIDRNWKTKYCEIDIVSQKNEIIFFTEVKYRKTSNQGGGMAAITQKKLRQMKFAAAIYAKAHKINDTDLILAAVSLTGSPPMVEEYLTID